jgi:putative ABC transport system permease protein
MKKACGPGASGDEPRKLSLSRPFRGSEVDDELEFHFAETIEGLIDRGWPPARARAEAERRFGDRRRHKRNLEGINRAVQRQHTRLAMWDAIRLNVRDAARGLRRTPGMAAAVILLLALGIGANATMFEIVDRLLLRPPDHVTDADRLRLVYSHRPLLTLPRFVRPYADVADLKGLPALEAVSAFTPRRWMTTGTGAAARRLRVQLAEASYFTTLGVQPLLGRFYGQREDEPGASLTAVVSAPYWQREMGGDPRVLGRVLSIGKARYEIVGVAPDGFTGAELTAIDVWLPLRAATASEFGHEMREVLDSRTMWWTNAVVRLKPGVTDDVANEQMTAAHIAARHNDERRGGERYLSRGPVSLFGTSLIAARRPGPSMTFSVSLCLAAVSAIVLIIACANVANLLLTRGIQTRRELSVRAALGAARGRLAGLVITETAMLAAAGAIMALVVARCSRAAARSFLPDIVFSETGINTRLLLFSAAAAVLTVMFAGIIPALHAAGASATEALRGVTRGSSARRSRTRNLLMIGQTALSVVLLVGAGLFVRSFHRAATADVGFEHGRIITASIEGHTGITIERRNALYREALARAAAIPGVSRAALSMESTIAFGEWSGPGGIKVEGRKIIAELPDGGPFLYSGSEGFFETLGVPIVRGRSFSAADALESAEPVGMVSETFVRTIWPDRDPIGQCFTIGASSPLRPSEPRPCRRVIGVFGDFARVGIRDTGTIAVAVPSRPERRSVQALVVRTSTPASEVGANGDPAVVAALLRQMIIGISPEVRFVQVNTMAERYDRLLEPWRLGATMFAVLGLLALVVAIVGLYAVLAFGVAQRRRELGIRSALGARWTDLTWLVMRQASAFIITGLAIGAALAAAAGRFIEGLLFDVRIGDPLVYGVVVIVLCAAGLAASLGPAWRATSVNPASALQTE